MTNLPSANATTMLDAAPFVPSTTYYLSLHTGDPGITGANELSGGSYARQAIVFLSASGGSLSSNSTGQSFSGMPADTITNWGVWSALSGGTFEGGGVLTSSEVVPSGATVTVAGGAITVTVS